MESPGHLIPQLLRLPGRLVVSRVAPPDTLVPSSSKSARCDHCKNPPIPYRAVSGSPDEEVVVSAHKDAARSPRVGCGVIGRRHPNQRRAADLPAELRRAPVPSEVRRWIATAIGAPVVSVRRLPGASTAAVHAVTLADGRNLVVRQYAWAWVLVDEPEAPTQELEALVYGAEHGLPVPAVVAADLSGEEVGDGVPVLLMERLRGRAVASPDITKLARLLAQLHNIAGVGFQHRYFPWCRDSSTRPPKACRNPAGWQEALDVWRSSEPAYRPVFIHRDFHPGNVLWWRGRVSGLVDWANACIGPAGIDVSTCRWNLAEWAGEGVASAFVTAYDTLTGRQQSPYWDVAWVLEHDWDQVAAPERVWTAEGRLADALTRLRHARP